MGKGSRCYPLLRHLGAALQSVQLCNGPHTSLFTRYVTRMHVHGQRCTKFVVPSTGSIVHVGASVRTYFSAAVSSPMMACCGNRPRMRLVMICTAQGRQDVVRSLGRSPSTL